MTSDEKAALRMPDLRSNPLMLSATGIVACEDLSVIPVAACLPLAGGMSLAAVGRGAVDRGRDLVGRR